MRWLMTCNSNHPLAQVSFLNLYAIISKALIHVNFFRSHGLRLYYLMNIVFPADLNEDSLYLIAVLSTIEYATALLNTSLELIC